MAPPTLLHEPKQERSRRTTERVLDAFEEMLREGPFEEVTIRELLRRAKTTAGSFYARFPTKEALLPVLYDRHDARLQESQSALLEELARAQSLEGLIVAISRRVVRQHRERRWFTRAVALHARQHPQMIPIEQRERRHEVHRAWQTLVLRFRDRIGHPDPEQAVALGLFMVVSTCREKIVFSDAPLATSFVLSDSRLAEELAGAFLAYLAVRPRRTN